ncbi:MAG TPA: sigma-70 family RNA polymerase sigma factor [Planctomycetota bacterium]|nr:sigma-70 family RNA polymerase sigma factor [Planctomycetota bacterium]
MVEDLSDTWHLVRKAQTGDDDSLNRLFDRYYDRVRRSVHARLGGQLRQRLETSDILQLAFAKAFQNFDRFEMRHEGSLMHWLAEYAQRQMNDAADRENADKRREPAPPLRLDDSNDGLGRVELPAPGRRPSEILAAAEDRAAIDACLAKLPEHYRRVIVLRDYDGLEWLEIARVMQKNSDSAVRELHRRAVLELAHQLARRGYGPGSR